MKNFYTTCKLELINFIVNEKSLITLTWFGNCAKIWGKNTVKCLYNKGQ